MLLWPITPGTNQNSIKVNTRNWRQARENACDQVTICFSLASDWLKKWREFFEPIRERSLIKQNQSKCMFIFNTQLNTTLMCWPLSSTFLLQLSQSIFVPLTFTNYSIFVDLTLLIDTERYVSLLVPNVRLRSFIEPVVYQQRQADVTTFGRLALVFDWTIIIGNSSDASTRIWRIQHLFPDISRYFPNDV